MTFLTALVIFALDRAAKLLVLDRMFCGQSTEILPGIFNFTLVFNNGTAFGLLKGQNTTLAAFSALAVIVISGYALKNKKLDPALSVALGMLLGGALGNLLDRARFGYVIDFLDFRVWPVFNLADSAITVGIALLCWRIIRSNRG